MKEMIRSYGELLIEDPALSRRVCAETAAILNVNNVTARETESLVRLAQRSDSPVRDHTRC